MTHKHTPGPWTPCPLPRDRLGRWLVTSPGAGTGKPVICERIRTEANAKLIAAAPDLLTALEAVVAAARVSDTELALALDAARTAIAKATS